MNVKVSTFTCITAISALLWVAEARIARAEPAASTLPAGFSVTSGSVNNPVTAGSAMTIDQHSHRAVITWDSFDIGRDASVNFHQPDHKSIAVNHITGSGDPTQIHGRLKANGRLVILDQNGIIFGSNAKVDVGGLIAATGYVDNPEEFNSGGQLRLAGMDATRANAAISNAGHITAAEGGLVALVAPSLRNSGVIQVRMGQATLASGRTATVDFHGDGLVQLAVTSGLTQKIDGDQITNNGRIAADGGHVYMTARAGAKLVDKAINNTGIVSAQRVSLRDGKIVLDTGGTPQHMQNAVFVGTDVNIQTIADDLSGSESRNIYLAPGLYYQTVTLTDGLALRGTAFGGATLYGDGQNTPALYVSGHNVTIEGLSIDNKNGIGLYAQDAENLTVTGNAFNASHDFSAIKLKNTQASLAGNTFIYSGDAGPIRIKGSAPVTLSGNSFIGRGEYAVKTEYASAVSLRDNIVSGDYARTMQVSGGNGFNDRQLRLGMVTPPPAPQKTAEIIILPAGGMTAAAMAALSPAAGGDEQTCATDGQSC